MTGMAGVSIFSWIPIGLGLLLVLAPHRVQRTLLHLYRDSPFAWGYRGTMGRISFVVMGLGLLAVFLVLPLLGRCIFCENPQL